MAMSAERTPRRHGEAGVTLVETLVAMALFALIGLAGFGVVDGVLRVQSRTETRLDALAAMQRAMVLLTLDIEQVADGALAWDEEGLALRRRVAGADDVTVRYGVADDAFTRRVIDPFGTPGADQRLLEDVGAVSWRFFTRAGGWVEAWPPEGDEEAVPAAIEAVLQLSPATPGGGGDLRRVAVLPESVRP